MKNSTKILAAVLVLMGVGYMANAALSYREPPPNFLQKNYWGDDSLKDKFEKKCAANDYFACSKVGYIEEKAGRAQSAKSYYEKACKLGQEYGCQRMQDIDWYNTLRDPFADIVHETLPNGLRLVSRHQKDSNHFEMAVQVLAGINDERKAQRGVAHLTEHVMFRDARLPDNKNYRDIVEETTGRMNGYTNGEATLYNVTAADVSGARIADLMVQMFDRKSLVGNIEKSRSEVLLERQINYPRLVSAISWIFSSGDNRAFFDREFGLKTGSEDLSAEIISTKKLTTKDVNAFYKKYYVPENMVVYVAGNIKADVLQKVRAGFAKLPASGKAFRGFKNPKTRNVPFVNLDYTRALTSPAIQIGTKYSGVRGEDVVATDIYMEYTAARIMEELRNDRGETYTARGMTFFRSFGNAFTNFEVKKEQLFTYIAAMRNLYRSEIGANKITDQQLRDAIWLYRLNYKKKSKNPDVSIFDVIEATTFRMYFDTDKSPFVILSEMTPEKLRKSLAKSFKPQNEYLEFTNPHVGIVFALLLVLAMVSPFVWFRMRGKAALGETKFEHLQPVAAIRFGWLTIIGSALLLWKSVITVEAAVFGAIPGWKLDPAAYATLDLGLSIGAFFVFASCFAKMRSMTLSDVGVSGNTLVLRTRHQVVRRVLLSDIKSIAMTRAMHTFSLDTLWLHLPHLELYRRGLHLQLVDGSSLFVAPKNILEFLEKLNAARGAQASSNLGKNATNQTMKAAA